VLVLYEERQVKPRRGSHCDLPLTRLPVSAVASQRAVILLHDYSLAHGLGIPDALIAAIALAGNHALVTSNLRNFFGLSLAYAWSRPRTGSLNRILPPKRSRLWVHSMTFVLPIEKVVT
jgi:hypothetical protein